MQKYVIQDKYNSSEIKKIICFDFDHTFYLKSDCDTKWDLFVTYFVIIKLLLSTKNGRVFLKNLLDKFNINVNEFNHNFINESKIIQLILNCNHNGNYCVMAKYILNNFKEQSNYNHYINSLLNYGISFDSIRNAYINTTKFASKYYYKDILPNKKLINEFIKLYKQKNKTVILWSDNSEEHIKIGMKILNINDQIINNLIIVSLFKEKHMNIKRMPNSINDLKVELYKKSIITNIRDKFNFIVYDDSIDVLNSLYKQGANCNIVNNLEIKKYEPQE